MGKNGQFGRQGSNGMLFYKCLTTLWRSYKSICFYTKWCCTVLIDTL